MTSQEKAAWAVKVLDAWAERIGKSCAPCPDGDGRWFIPTLASCFTADSPDACRIKAAEELVESLPSLNVQPSPSTDSARPSWWSDHDDGARGMEKKLNERVHTLDLRFRESRALLHRLVKYVREDRAVTRGKTRLARLCDQVADYLIRTHEPSDILRDVDGLPDPPDQSATGWIRCDDRMPDDPDATVLVYFTSNEILTAAFDGDDWLHGASVIPRRAATHWMPIPPPPAAENGT